MDDKEKEGWLFESQIFIKRNFIATICFEGKPATVKNIRMRIANLTNALNISKTSAMQAILIRGLETIENDIEDGEQGKLPEFGTPEAKDWAIAQEVKRILEQKSRIKALIPIYDAYGPDGFISWCEGQGIDYEDFLKDFSWRGENLTQNNRDRDWLLNYLPRGEEVSTRKIKESALADGIIGDDDKDWRRLSKTAERMGLTGGKHGCWKYSE